MAWNGVLMYVKDYYQEHKEEEIFGVYEDQYTSCSHPGKNGCGFCDACAEWADTQYDRYKFHQEQDGY